MVLGPDASSNQQGWWGVHSHKSRMIIMRLEPESQHAFYIYIVGPPACSMHLYKNEEADKLGISEHCSRYRRRGDIRSHDRKRPAARS